MPAALSVTFILSLWNLWASQIIMSIGTFAMAQSSPSAKTLGFCMANMELGGNQYANVLMSILPGLCADLLLRLDFKKHHQSVISHHGGPQ